MSPGPGSNEAGQTLTFHVSTSNNALFSVLPSIDPATGNLTYTLADNASGSATITVTLSDNGGTANDGVDTSAEQTFVINATFVNDVPSFGGVQDHNQTVLEDSGAHTVTAFATDMSPGPGSNEAGQTLTFHVSTSNNALFSVLPSIDPATGNLTYTLADNASGSATITVTLSDNGGTANDGVDTSAEQTFVINATFVNDVPSFGGVQDHNQTVLEDSGAHTVTAFATDMSPGPGSNEAGQTLTFHVSTSNNALFSVLPSIDPATGNLTYTLADNASGSATITVTLSDNGGTANDGVDTSAEQTFVINATFVNDVPSFGGVQDHNQTVLEDSGAHTVTAFATDMSPGPGSNEAGQTLTFHVSTSNNALFSVLSLHRPRHRQPHLHPRRQRQRISHHHRHLKRQRRHR